MAEALLELDITPALSAIDEISTALDDVVAGFSDQLATSFNLDTSGLQNLPDVSSGLNEIGDAGKEAASGLDIAGLSMAGLDTSAGVLEGSASGLLSTLVPGIAIFGGLTAAIGGLVERGDKAILATERMDQVFQDQSPLIFSRQLDGLNLNLDQLTTKSGASASGLKLAMATFGQTAIGAGATAEEAGNVAQQMGEVASIVTTLNPTLGTSDQIFQTLSRGLGGSTRILQRYGITIDAAAQSTLALQIAQEHGRTKASLYDKQVAGTQLALAALQKQATDSGTTLQDELDKGLDGSTVKFRALRQEISSTVTALGVPIVDAVLKITQAFQPLTIGIIKAFGGIVDEVVPLVVPLAEKISAALLPIVTKLPELFKPLTPILGAVFNVLGQIFDILGPVVGLFLDLGIHLANAVSPFVVAFFNGVADALAKVVPLVQDAVTWIGDKLGPAFDKVEPLLKAMGIDLNGPGGVAHGLGEAAVAGAGAYLSLKGIEAIAGPVGTVLQAVAAGLEILMLNPFVTGLVLLAAAFFALYEVSSSFRKEVDKLWQMIQDDVLPVLEKFAVAVGDVLSKALKTTLDFLKDDVVPFFKHDLIPAISDASDAVATFLSPTGANSTDLFGAIGDSATNVSNVITKAFNSAQKAIDDFFNTNTGHLIEDMFGGIAQTVDELKKNLDKLFGTSGAGGWVAFAASVATFGPAGTALAGVGKKLYDGWQPFRRLIDAVGPALEKFARNVEGEIAPVVEQIATKFDKLAPQIEKTVSKIIKLVSSLGRAILVVLTPVVDFMSHELGPALEVVGDQFQVTFELIGNVVSAGMDIVLGVINLVLDILSGDWGAAWGDIVQVLNGVWELIKGVAQAGIDSVLNILNFVLNTIKALWETIWDGIGGFVSTIWDTIVQTVTNGINNAWNSINFVLAILVGVWNGVWNGLSNVVSSMWNGLVGIVRGGINDAIIDPLNDVIKALDSIHIHIPGLDVGPIHIGGQDIGFDIGTIHRLHTGGIVPGPIGSEVPIMALAGERVQSIGERQRQTAVPVVNHNQTFEQTVIFEAPTNPAEAIRAQFAALRSAATKTKLN